MDTIVAKFKADGSGLVYAGFLGRAGEDAANDIALDGSGNVYVTG